MKNRWSVNWLIIITAFLLVSAFIMLIISYKETIEVKTCSYAGWEYPMGSNISDISGKNNCICNMQGKVVCDDGLTTVSPSEFTSSGLTFQNTFVAFTSDNSSIISDIKFVDISQTSDSLDIDLERKSICSTDGIPAPATGFVKQSPTSLVLTVATNLLNVDFNTECIVHNTYTISDIKQEYPTSFTVSYQDEKDVLISANNCVYEGRLRNNGDVYQSKDRCSLCTCNMGLNKCEKETNCSLD